MANKRETLDLGLNYSDDEDYYQQREEERAWLEFAGKSRIDWEFREWQDEQYRRLDRYLGDWEMRERLLNDAQVSRTHPLCPRCSCSRCQFADDCKTIDIGWSEPFYDDADRRGSELLDNPWEDAILGISLSSAPLTEKDIDEMIDFDERDIAEQESEMYRAAHEPEWNEDDLKLYT